MISNGFPQRLRRVRTSALVVTFLGGCPLAALAAEGGVTHYVPGTAATLIDLPPTKPGWVVEGVFLNYEGKTSADKSFPVAGSIAAGLDAKTDAFLTGAFYTFDSKVFGAHYSVGAFLPYVSVDVSANIETSQGSVRRKDSASGLGDMTLIPVMLAWKQDSWQYSAFLPIYAPTGDYQKGRLANQGLNYWTVDPTVNVSYNNAKTGLNAALFAGVSFNTRNDDTDYKSGTVFHAEGSVQQLLPVGSGFLGIGANAFYVDQVSSDSGGSGLLGGFKGRTAGIGPVLSYILPHGKNTLVAEFKWLPELDVKKRLDGDYLWLKVVYQF